MIKIKLNILLIFVFLFLLISCQIQYSPWETDLDNYDVPTDLTQKNITKLNDKWESKSNKDSLKIAIISDTHLWYSSLKKAVNLINKDEDIDFVVLTGDITEAGLIQEYKWFYDSIKKLNKPWISVIGNHDCLNNGISLYNSIFGDEHFRIKLKHENSYYNFVFMNNNSLELNYSEHEYRELKDWLLNSTNLENESENNIDVLVQHIPIRESIYFDAYEITQYEDMINTANFEFVLAGHAHALTKPYSNKDGIYYFIADAIKKTNYSVMTFYLNTNDEEDFFRYENIKF